jgi:hypothetical protein
VWWSPPEAVPIIRSHRSDDVTDVGLGSVRLGQNPARSRRRTGGCRVLVLGVILMLIGLLLSVPVLWTIGIILAVIGAVLWIAEGSGAHWGRRWY